MVRGSSKVRRALRAAALALVVGMVPAGAAAQEGVHLRLIPRAGAVTPADWFYEEFPHFGIDPMEWTEAAVLRTAVAGLTAELTPGGNGLWIRGELLTTISAETSVTYALLIPPSLLGPARVVRVNYRIPTTITMGSVDVGLPTAFRLPFGVQPYVTAGVGGKRYAFDNTAIAAWEGQIVFPQSGTVFMVNVGAGARFRVLGVPLDLLARDAISRYWGKQQHDVTLLAGIAWTLF